MIQLYSFIFPPVSRYVLRVSARPGSMLGPADTKVGAQVGWGHGGESDDYTRVGELPALTLGEESGGPHRGGGRGAPSGARRCESVICGQFKCQSVRFLLSLHAGNSKHDW